MAQYVCKTADRDGVLCTGVAVANGDTVSGNDINAGAILIITAGGTPTNVSFVDTGHTPAGTVAGTVTPVTVAANTSQAFADLAGYIDGSNAVVVNYSSTTSVTAMLVRKP